MATGNRRLGKLESIVALADAAAVLNIVTVIRLEPVPRLPALRGALDRLQGWHPFLNVRIRKCSRHYRFESGGVPPIPLEHHPRTGAEVWREIVERELNRAVDCATGPPMRCTLISSGESEAPGEIVLTGQHAVMDGVSLLALLQELLSLCAEPSVPAPRQPAAFALPPPVEEILPGRLRGAALWWHSLPFFARRMWGELRLRAASDRRRRARGLQKSRCRIVTRSLPAGASRALLTRARDEEIGLNSVLNAALLLTVHRRLLHERTGPVKGVFFANLRPELEPTPPDGTLACLFSMLEFVHPMRRGLELWPLAKEIHQRVAPALRRGDLLLGAIWSRLFMRRLFRRNRRRMSATAVSYFGGFVLARAYGPHRVEGFHAFVSNFSKGSEFTLSSRVYREALWLDFVYLMDDMEPATARRIADEVKAVLEGAALNRRRSDGASALRSPLIDL